MGIARMFGLAAVAVSILSAQDQAGNQIFHIPPGWNRTDSPGITMLEPAAEPKNLVALVLSGRPLNGDFRQTFDGDVKGTIGKMRVVHAGEVQSRHTPEGVDLLATTLELQQGLIGPRSLRYYMAAAVKGRFEILVFMAGTPVLFQRYWPAVQQFVTTWSFANLKAAAASDTAAAEPAPPPPETAAPPSASAGGAAPNVLDGVYGGYKFIYTTVSGVVQRKAVNDYFSFFPNGTVYWGFPQTGLTGFNPESACQNAVEFCGTYQMNGDRVTILLNRGTYRQVGTLAPGGLQIEDRKYTLQGDIAKSSPHALEGDFGRADAQPGEDLARRFIRFSRDGRFVDQGIVTTVTSSDISTGSPRFEREYGAGTYTLEPYTLILRYSDGYRRQLGVTMEPADMDKPALTKIFVNTYTLVRRR